MRFGLLITNQHLPSEPLAERFAETIEQVRLARALGFDLILFGQHFLVNEFQMLQPAVAAARLAAEAGPMRVGITIYLLSLLNPVAVAEEVATLDILTGGRFIFGVGLGYRDVEDQAFGLSKGERVSRLLSHLEVIRRLWAGEAVTFDSPYCRLAGARTALRPELPMMREICVAESRAEAVRLARPHLEQKYRAYVQWGQHRALPRDDDMTQAFDDLIRDRFILGDPSECAAEIRRCVAATGATTLLFRLHWPGMSHETVTRAMRLLAEKVRPLVG
ncbi:MAG: LLM class flavin-dependent oxidoreductase [Candidatus Rokubacteria bacterium]|nr:LLM class flavin-dependent oxidoreductase [Candidatus Rokubacteria bacterium]